MNGCEPRHFLQPCLLLLLRERPSHGYELAERLHRFHLAEGESAHVYRTLRALERDGYVESAWRPSQSGPARRTYHLTASGSAALDRLVADLQETRKALDALLQRYGRAVAVGVS